MLIKIIACVMVTTALLLAPPGFAAAIESVPAVVSVRAEKGQRQNEFVFRATVADVTPGDRRYQVLLALADRSGEFKDSDADLLKAMVWNDAAGAWMTTRTVDKFSLDKTRRYRVAVRNAASGAYVAVGQDQTLLQPGKAPSISRQEAMDFLALLSKEYTAKNYAGFMSMVSPEFAGDDFTLANAVRKDFQLLSDISIRFTVNSVTANAEFATVGVGYQRSVSAMLTGQRLNDSGMSELVLYKEKGKLRLYSMKKPLLFGLANAGAAATGVVSSGQNQNVTQIKKDGTIVVEPVTATVAVNSGDHSVPVKTVALQKIWDGSNYGQTLRLSDGTQSSTIMLSNLVMGSFSGDIGFAKTSDSNGLSFYHVIFKGSHQILGVTDINSVTSVPASGYNGGQYITTGFAPVVFAVHLTTGNYAVVEVGNWMGGTILPVRYKYQTDGTRNF